MKPSLRIPIFASMANQSSVFLESHNLKNEYSGFGQFNKHLIDALLKQDAKDLQFVVHARNTKKWSSYFGEKAQIKKYFAFTRIKGFGIRSRYDIWHSLNQNSRTEPLLKLPYVLTIHDVNFIDEISSDLDHKKNKRFQKKLDRSAAITYISAFAKESTHRHFKIPNVPEYIIHNGNTITEITLPEDYVPEVMPTRPFFFTIGDVCERKNQHTLLEMLVHLPDYELVISGKMVSDYAKSTMKSIIKNLGLSDRVHLTNRISDLDKYYYYKHCEAFLFPTLREGFGIPVIEAMRFSKPAFIANNTSLPEVGSDLAFYWDHYDAHYMASIVQEGLKSFENDKERLANKYVAHSQKFCWNEAARQYINVYREVLKNTP